MYPRPAQPTMSLRPARGYESSHSYRKLPPFDTVFSLPQCRGARRGPAAIRQIVQSRLNLDDSFPWLKPPVLRLPVSEQPRLLS